MTENNRPTQTHKTLPAARPNNNTSLDFSSSSCSPLDRRVTDLLDYLQHDFSGYPFNRTLDTNFILELAADFERINLLEQTKTFRWYYDDDISRVGNPRAALRRWMARAYNRSS